MPTTPREDAAAALAALDPFGDLGVQVPALSPVPEYQRLAAREFAERLGSRRRTAGAPVRTIFVSDEQVARAPLATLLSSAETGGGGRGGQIRAKLYLSLLWVCAREPYDVARPARAWAALLGLPDHENGGVRRIQQALRDLADRGFISLEDRGGLPSRVVMKSERGDGGAFVPAPEAYNSLGKDTSDAVTREHRYFRVPSSLWTEGHIARLKGPSLGMLLALLSERRGQASPAVWFSPGRAQERFGFSPSTRREGLQHLRDLGLVVTKTKVVSEQGAYIDWARRRSVHEVVGL
jgi:hypothetical protein